MAGDPNNNNFRVRDVSLPKSVLEARFTTRRDLRAAVDRLPRMLDEAAGDPVAGLDESYNQAYNLVTSPEAQKALDIHNESDTVREAYGRNSFGQRALLARRLVEAGVPFITFYDGGWDHHSDIFPGLTKRLPTFDSTIAALITDLDSAVYWTRPW